MKAKEYLENWYPESDELDNSDWIDIQVSDMVDIMTDFAKSLLPSEEEINNIFPVGHSYSYDYDNEKRREGALYVINKIKGEL